MAHLPVIDDDERVRLILAAGAVLNKPERTVGFRKVVTGCQAGRLTTAGAVFAPSGPCGGAF